MASRFTSAAQGAATGAGLGTAISPGLGTAVGAGVGAVGGLIGGGETEAEGLQRERVEELMRRQELGALGLTEQEMAVALGQAQGALGQQQQAQAAQQRAALATQDLGAGAVFRAQQEEASQQRREMEAARQKVLQRDVAEKRAQEAEIQQLSALEQKRAQEERAATISALSQVGTQAFIGGQLKSQREAAVELLAKQKEDRAQELVDTFNKAIADQDDAAVEAAFVALGGGFKDTPADFFLPEQTMSMVQQAQAEPDGIWPSYARDSAGQPLPMTGPYWLEHLKRNRERQMLEGILTSLGEI